MKSPPAAWLRIAFVAVVVALLAPSSGLARDDGDVSTEDILHMVDGRELHGRILTETKTQIVFEIIDLKLHMKSRRTFRLDEIAHIERGVVVDDKAQDEALSSKKKNDPATTSERTSFGRARPAGDAPNLPGLYLIPMKGQMGTDIHPSIYEKVAEDIRLHDPDVIIIKLDSKDYEDSFAAALGDVDLAELSRPDFDEYKDLVNIFRDDLRDIRQVMWVQDSIGISSTVALAWDELYMTPSARLGGMRAVFALTGADQWSDDDIRAKMMAAWMGSAKSLLEYGGYGLELADAMVDPTYKLSASFKGREVVWSLNDLGEFLVDDDDENTVDFSAKAAEDLAISDGTVETLDDLAFLLGYREYRVIEGKGEQLVENYTEQWRRSFENSKKWLQDYFQHQRWATGDETLKWLGRAKRDLENIIKAMERYKAVEIRWRTDLGKTKLEMEIEVEKIKEQIRALKQQDRGRGGGGRGMGRGGTGRR
ncbi:MAG: hypothetical protein IH983_07650 [Planctomycetes bacterium]|nr:hypothetical protein [Planctomycetota bacterium]